MSAPQEAPWAFRIKPELENQVRAAMEVLGWTRTRFMNEALEIALPLLLRRQAELFEKLADRQEMTLKDPDKFTTQSKEIVGPDVSVHVDKASVSAKKDSPVSLETKIAGKVALRASKPQRPS